MADQQVSSGPPAKEYAVGVTYKDGMAGQTNVTGDPKEAGKKYRELRDALPAHGGGKVELLSREVQPWKAVETAES